MIRFSSEIPNSSVTDVTSPFSPSWKEGYIRNRDDLVVENDNFGAWTEKDEAINNTYSSQMSLLI